MTRELLPSERMAAAVLEAINREACDASDAEIPLFDPQTAIEGLTMALAMIIESHPGIETPKDIRLSAEAVADSLKRQIKRFRQIYEQMGEHAFDARPVRLQ